MVGRFAHICQDIPLLFKIKLRLGFLYKNMIHTLLRVFLDRSSVDICGIENCFEPQL